jgi:hypothetical protein
MKTREGITIVTFTILPFLAFGISSWAQSPEKSGCFEMDGRTHHGCGESWRDTYNGAVYDCTCNCASRGSDCKPRSKSNTTGGFSIPIGGPNPAQAMALGIIGAFLNEALSVQPDNSHQKQLNKQEEEQKRLAEEQAKKAALERWLQFQTQEDLQRKMEQEARIKQGEKMLSQMQTVGDGRKLEAFSFGNPKLDLKPLSQHTYPNTKLKTWERLLCSASFSNMAKQSTKDVDARFYADQAQRVMVGEPTYLECNIPQVSNEKLAKRIKEVKKIYDEMNVKIKDLQDIEYKISESKKKIENAELKKEEATAKLNELKNRAATATPEEKVEVDDLAAMVQKQLQDAEQELNQAKQTGKDDLNKKEQLENELGNMSSQMQAMTQAGGE